MNRRSFLSSGCALMAGSMLLPERLLAKEAEKPNIVIVLADDLGWNDVSYHGSEIKTPNIDRIVKEGVELERFYVCPVCSPTRATLLSGRHPLRYGMQEGVCTPLTTHGLPPKEVTLAEMLGSVGYEHRACLGKWHLGLNSQKFDPISQGFNYFYGHYNGALDYFTHKRYGQLDWHRNREACVDGGYSTDLLGREAVSFIDKYSDDSPFLLYVAFNAPHGPMQAKRGDLEDYGFDHDKGIIKNSSKRRGKREMQPDYGDLGRGNTVRQTYSAMVAAMDEQIGNILNALDKNKISENTIVLFQSDNGGIANSGGSNKPLRGGKFTLWEGGVRVPAAIRWPKKLRSGVKQNAVTGAVDILPTVAEITGAKKPEAQLDGRSIWGILKGEEKSDPERKLYLGERSAVMQRWKINKGRLFDLTNDPYEKNNIADKRPDIVKKLNEFIEQVESKAGEKCNLGPEKTDDFAPPKDWNLGLLDK
ncbi:arylsulfatase B [Sedimentisphaera salicampi]|uniref:Arylsulfatase n=1 Tax=Sedimentisphaera salicampi TaxID=1941349 RepID=A0A1W6LNK7_9BACT|nr:arylsulfatase [Sedimentisphaera salicampi]ARN57357.1 Arylsulfatase [Sedimentisphaera salicampi]